MYDYKDSNIEKYRSFFLNLFNEVAKEFEKENDQNFREYIKQRFEFDRAERTSFLQAYLYNLLDTQVTIFEYKNKLLSIKEDNSDIHLRIFGVLSAIYIQKIIFIELCKLFNIDERDSTIRKINSMKAVRLRNIIAAHTVNFKRGDKKNQNFTHFKIKYEHHEDDIVKIFDEENKNESFCINQVIDDFHSHIEDLFLKIVSNALGKLYKENNNKLKLELNRLNGLSKK